MRVRCKCPYSIIIDKKTRLVERTHLEIDSYLKVVFEKGLYYELLEKKDTTNNKSYTISTPLHDSNIILYDYSFDYHFDNEMETRQEMINQLLL